MMMKHIRLTSLVAMLLASGSVLAHSGVHDNGMTVGLMHVLSHMDHILVMLAYFASLLGAVLLLSIVSTLLSRRQLSGSAMRALGLATGVPCTRKLWKSVSNTIRVSSSAM